jgi:hypothetical protein
MTAPIYYIHEVYREDLSDPEYPTTWYEYRVSKSKETPDFYGALAGGEGEDGLQSAYRFIKQAGGAAVMLWDGESSED